MLSNHMTTHHKLKDNQFRCEHLIPFISIPCITTVIRDLDVVSDPLLAANYIATCCLFTDVTVRLRGQRGHIAV